MIWRVMPTHGKKNPVVYLSVCSVVGSVSVMAIKVRQLRVGSSKQAETDSFLHLCRASASLSSSPSLETTNSPTLQLIFLVLLSLVRLWFSELAPDLRCRTGPF